MTTNKESLFSFGVISDIQYANFDDKKHYSKPKWRYYRHALDILQEAVSFWKQNKKPIKFVLNNGDIIDALNKTALNESHEALEKVLKVFSQVGVNVFHTVGNHEVYNFSREELIKGPIFPRNLTFDHALCYPSGIDQKVDSDKLCYYSFCPHPRFLVIVLDCYEISILGYPPEHPNYKLAEKILQNKNKNADWNSTLGLIGAEKRFAVYNGGLSETQLDWLKSLLQNAEQKGQKVIIAGHISLYHKSIQSECSLVWNYEKILDIIYQYSCVVAYFAGHDHDGGYAMDDHGIHHLTLPGVVEVPLDSTGFGICDVYEDHIHLHGHGIVQTRILPFRS